MLYDINQWLILSIIALLYFFFVVGSYCLGLRSKLKTDLKFSTLRSNLQAPALGLLALLLGFTFAMAVSRYEERKDRITEESNAINTSYLRAKLLPKNLEEEISTLLKNYAEKRLKSLTSSSDSYESNTHDEEAEKIQLQIWNKVSSASKEVSSPHYFTFFLESVNHLINLYAQTEMTMANHVSEMILFLLFLVTILALSLTGYTQGLEGTPHLFPVIVLTALILLVTTVIIDLDRPLQGLIKLNLDNMISLKDLLIYAP